MNKKVLFVFLTILFLLGICVFLNFNKVDNKLIVKEISSDNNYLILYIKYNNLNILFDTGSNKQVLLNDLKNNNLDIKKMDYIIISHYHFDHSGGLLELEEQLSLKTKVLINEKVYEDIKRKLVSYPKKYLDNLERHRRTGNLKITTGDFAIKSNIIYTNALEAEVRDEKGKFLKIIYESCLIIKKDKELIMLVGCAHPRIHNLCEYAKKITKCNKISAVIGGLGKNTEESVKYLNNTHAQIYAIHSSNFFDYNVLNLKKLPMVFK